MRKISLTADERQWLLPLLTERLTYFNEHEPSVPRRFYTNTLSAFTKISVDSNLVLQEWERVMCSSVTNEKLRELYNTVELPDAFSLLNISAIYRAQLAEIDLAENILTKVGRKKQNLFRFI